MEVVAGIDLGGTAINCTLLSGDGKFLIEELREHPALSKQGPDFCLQQNSSHVFLDGQDQGVCSLVWQGWLEWYLGRPDQALLSTMQGVELARRIEHPFSLSDALNFAARLHICRREPEASERYASESLRCAEEYGLTPMFAIGQVLHGWSVAFLGDSAASIPELEEGVARWRSTGAA